MILSIVVEGMFGFFFIFWLSEADDILTHLLPYWLVNEVKDRNRIR